MFWTWFLSLKSETNLPVFLLLVFSHLVFILESSGFYFLIIVEEAKSFPVNFKKLTDPVYTNIFLERELRKFWNCPWAKRRVYQTTSLCFIHCVVLCFFKKKSPMSHFHNGDWKQMTDVSPQKTWFFWSHLCLKNWHSGLEFSSKPLSLEDPTPTPAPAKTCVLLGWLFRWVEVASLSLLENKS